MTSSGTESGTPVPYCGPLDARAEKIGTPHVLHRCGLDDGGKTTYAYNSLGYRGDEFVRGARLTVFAFGESDAFGLGVAYRQAWPTVVTAMLADALGVDAADVCLMNFAESGGSNGSTTRMVFTQCGALRPDLVLINLAEPIRTEGVIDGRIYNVGPWFQEKHTEQTIRAIPDPASRDLYTRAWQRGLRFCEFTNSEHGQIAALQSLLSMQAFVRSQDLHAVCTSAPWNDPTKDAPSGYELIERAIRPLIEQVDRDFFRPHDVTWPTPDRSADGGHLGPRSHQQVAKHVFDRIATSGLLERLRAGQ